MFEHSVKVPRLYKAAAKILKTVKEDGGSLKSLVYSKKHERLAELYSIVSKAVQNSSIIEQLITKSKILEKETRLDQYLAEILITQLLWGRKKLVPGSKPIDIILSFEEQLHKLFASYTIVEPVKLQEANKPRYVRINTLKSNVNEVLEELTNGGWTMQKYLQKDNYEGFPEQVQKLTEFDFMVDLHFPDLLIFNKGIKFYEWTSFKEKGIILQDKASCLPTFILNPPPGSTVLDMCAAPGMKTLHLAALMENKGKIYATELNPLRFKAMQESFTTSGGTCIESLNKDVLTLKQEELPGVEYILVDPSCSGTGMVNRANLYDQDKERVQKLKGFQILILKHAVRSFPQAKRIVYSTCSLNPEENEAVVKEIIGQSYFYRLANAREYLNAPWVNFGSKDYGVVGERCLYSKPDVDLCNGFFVAVFERLQEGETNDLLTKDAPSGKKKFKQGKVNNEHKNKKQNTESITTNGAPNKKNKQNQNNELETNVNDGDVGNKRKPTEDDYESAPVKKKQKKNKGNNNEVKESPIVEENNVNSSPASAKKNKKNRKNKVVNEENHTKNDAEIKESPVVEKDNIVSSLIESVKKNKQNRKSKVVNEVNNTEDNSEGTPVKRKQKKNKANNAEVEESPVVEKDNIVSSPVKSAKKNKKNKVVNEDNDSGAKNEILKSPLKLSKKASVVREDIDSVSSPTGSAKKNKKNKVVDEENDTEANTTITQTPSKKKNKKPKHNTSI